MGGASDEFPLLAAYGLYAADIKGDGNCLFNALSDQIYGHQNDHHKIRARVIEYMREHASYYKQFIDVQPGGGQRRNPKRKNAGVYSTPTSFTPPTPQEIDRVFESHLGSMARGGTYGDNMEISAFTSAFCVDVKIYQHDFAYMVAAPDNGKPRPVAHIAYHTWEHYSSIRNIDGPHTGLPNVQVKSLSAEDDAKSKAAAAKVSYVLPWMVNVVIQSLPYLADREMIKKTLEECKGNIDTAVSILLDAEDRASVSSQQGSSCTERDPDSDNEEFVGPKKKQDRRMSRATKALQKQKAEQESKGAAPPIPTIPKIEVVPPMTPSTPVIELPVRPHKQLQQKQGHRKMKNEDDEEWVTPSDDDGDNDFHPDLDEVDDDANSVYSGTSRQSQSRGLAPAAASKPLLITIHTAKSFQKQPGPQRKRQTARDRIEMKKAAQKAARKESKRNGAQASRQLEVTSINVNKNPPPLDLGMGIKTLYI